MADIMTLFLLAFAVSLDSFTVGFTYGMRKMGMPFKSILIIAFVSALAFFMSMLIGKSIAAFLSPYATEMIGGAILITIGIWVVYQFFRTDKTPAKDSFVWNFEIKSLGIMIQILKKPMVADIDKSGSITGIEAFILGFALSLDAFGAGIGAAMFGFAPFLTASIVAFMSCFFLWVGLKSGYLLSYWSWLQRLSFIPGIILIILGVLKMT